MRHKKQIQRILTGELITDVTKDSPVSRDTLVKYLDYNFGINGDRDVARSDLAQSFRADEKRKLLVAQIEEMIGNIAELIATGIAEIKTLSRKDGIQKLSKLATRVNVWVGSLVEKELQLADLVAKSEYYNGVCDDN